MRPKVILSVLVCLALLLPLGIAVKDVKADAIMFPWVTKSKDVSTIISVVNTAAGDPDFDQVLHYQYWHKIAFPHTDKLNDQENWCEEYDFKALISKDDLVSFDASGKINGGLPLWNDNSAQHPNDTLGFADSYTLVGTGDPDEALRAFLLVDNNTPNIAQIATNNSDGTLYGEAMVIELTTGAAWGYIAYNASGGMTSYQDDPVYFEDGLDLLGEVIGDDEETQTVILNPNSIKTRFFVTPITDNVDDTQDIHAARSPNTNVHVQLCRIPDQNGSCTSTGMYDNIEGPVSTSSGKEIVCTSADDLIELMGTSGYNAFKASGRSGWGYIVTSLGTRDVSPFDLIPDNPTGDAIIGKLEFTETELDIGGMTIPTTEGVAGGINSFLWLRDSETLTGEYGINYIHNEEYYR